MQLNQRIRGFIRDRFGRYPGRLHVRRMGGGLDSAGVFHVQAYFANGSPGSFQFVVKSVSADQAREATAYRLMLSRGGPEIAPRFLGAEEDEGALFLYLEYLRPSAVWPWRAVETAASVVERIAHIHSSLPHSCFQPPSVLAEWDYPAELQGSALSTVESLEALPRGHEWAVLRRGLPHLRRLAGALPRLHTEMQTVRGLQVALHGDVHTGNVLLRVRAGSLVPYLVDWSRTRLGSPMEDVSSWLQNLGFWEPEAGRRHDTLLKRYFRACGSASALTATVRDCYWIAAACNGFSGAVRYHLSLLAQEGVTAQRKWAAGKSLMAWMRVFRRADAASFC